VSIRAICLLAFVVAHVRAAHAGPTPNKQPAVVVPKSSDAEKMERVSGDRRRIVGILEVRVDGVPKEIAAQFQQNLEKQLNSSEYWLAPRTRMMQLLANSSKWTDGCVVGKCLTEVKTQTGAELVLIASITGSDSSFGYVVTLVRTDTGAMLSQESDRCDVCTVNEALTSATLAAVKLLTDVPETLPNAEAEAKATMAQMTSTHEKQLAATKRTHKRIAIVSTLVGLAAAGVGSALYFTQDKPPWALATAAAGGGLMVGGMLSLNF
jgi:hypothetical protein